MTNVSGLTDVTTLIHAQVLEAARLQSREHYKAPPTPVYSGSINGDYDFSGTLPPELNLPCKPVAVPGTRINTSHDLISPRPTFSEHRSGLTTFQLLKEQKSNYGIFPGLPNINMIGPQIPSPTATTRNSSVTSSRRDSLSPSPSPPLTPKKPPSIKINVRSSMRVDLTKIKPIPILSEQEQRIRNEKDAKRLEDKIQQERKATEEDEKRWRLEREEDEKRFLLEDQEVSDVIAPVFQSEAKTPYDDCYPIQSVVSAVRDNYPRKTDPSDLSWLSHMYGAPVYCSRLSEDYFESIGKCHVYITEYGRFVENLPCFGALVIYLHPIPRRNCDVFKYVTNTVYVIEEEVTRSCPSQVVIPRHIITASYERLQLEIIVTQTNPHHKYGLPMQLSLIIGKTVLYIQDQALWKDLKRGSIVPDSEPKLMVGGLWNEKITQLRQGRIQTHESKEEKVQLPSPVIVNKSQNVESTSVPSGELNEAAIMEREVAYRRERDRPKSDDDTNSQSSVGSKGSRVSVKPAEEGSIKGWAEDRYNIDEESTQVTDIKILYVSYSCHTKFNGMPRRRFTDCMMKIYPHLWKQIKDNQKKYITGYRGFSLKQ
jgi:hypothetical protein